MSHGRGDHNDEETPLLRVQNGDTSHKPTQLPTIQISVLVVPWIAESIVAHSISPYINQLVRELPIVGGDGRRVGYYTGIIISLHFVAEAVTSFHWNRLSDHIGRKPVFLMCLTGTIISIVLFGLSRSFLALVLSRCLHGAMKGHIGVVKSVMAELTDETNIVRGFSLLLMTWAIGYSLSPFIGGVLSKPQDRWPGVFSGPFWDEYPYFLPCLVSAAISCLSFIIVAIFLEEVLGEGSGDALDVRPEDAQKPLPLRSVLTRPVLISLANYAMISLLEMTSVALIPLIWSTSIQFGGLDLSPVSIGLWMSVYGCMDGIFQFSVSPHILGHFGPRYAFITSVAVSAASHIMFPLENLVRRHAAGGTNATTWMLILLHLFKPCGPLWWALTNDLPGAMYIYIVSAAPSKRSLGAVNGLAQTVSSVQRTVGPLAADSLFAFSVTNNVLGGKFVYVVLLALSCIGLCTATRLPRDRWRHGISQ
ncbi:MFS general substrate transporter [Russula earlei]|uniref:MFS general substrate transporter n=1 Tax=Russula earlei TaxID=71964 RepID=A0ACC0U3L7_9AGAM|nr:MFS general substrate transporter [Russula earlei]